MASATEQAVIRAESVMDALIRRAHDEDEGEPDEVSELAQLRAYLRGRPVIVRNEFKDGEVAILVDERVIWPDR